MIMQSKTESKTEEYLHNNYKGPFMATDVVIRYNDGKDGIVLIERKFEPYGIALPGGLAERMPFHQNAIKEAKEETGLDVILDDIDKPLCVLSELGQDPRAFIASVAYAGRGYGTIKPHEDEDAKKAFNCSYDNLAQLLKEDVWAFEHHRKIIRIFLEQEGYLI